MDNALLAEKEIEPKGDKEGGVREQEQRSGQGRPSTTRPEEKKRKTNLFTITSKPPNATTKAVL
jgi:hypothetical protein